MDNGLHAIDCDVHPTVPNVKALLPYLDDFWRDTVQERGIESLETVTYPPNAPLTSRPEWRGKNGQAATEVAQLAQQVCDRWQAGIAICNCLYGVGLLYSEDMANAFARALNDWVAKEWLDRDPRLRASIVIPTQNTEYCVDEIERCAKDRRFVQILVLAMQEVPLGRRQFWPIYAAAERHGLPLGIHAGSTYRHSITSLGWPSYYIEDYAAHTQAFQSQVASLVCEGVFAKYPGLKGGAARIGRDLASWLPVALCEILAWRARRGALGRPLAGRDRARPFPAHHPAVRRPDRSKSGGTGHRPYTFRWYTALRFGLSALAVRRRRDHAGRDPAGVASQDHGRESACDLSQAPGARAMNMEVRQPERSAKARVGIIDCDIHPKNSLEDLRPYLSNRAWASLQTYGQRQRHGYVKGYPYPKSQPLACRRDAWPPGGGLPASDLDFMREQLLDLYGIEHGVMNPLSPSGQGNQNDELSAAMAFATNEYQLENWNRREPRLKASVVVPYEDAEASVKEIRLRAGDPRFAHVLFLSRTSELLGKKRYWPIFEAAVESGRPVGVHVFGSSGRPMSNTGWPSFYIEEITEHSASLAASVTSLIIEGVFERWPELKFVLIEAGFGWIPSLGWRLDQNWKRMKDEVPHLRRAPSEYLREHFWVSTQPMEEAETPEHLIEVMNWIGWDKILFASDYPHWDFDDPFTALPPSLSEERRNQIYSGNAKALYRFA